ncbi:thioredoxin-disulfide reductase [Patescibacteria group bacterium]|nr:thioredoxin-disulfide reductase [Patescibacteria group bacterium]MBU4512212.1 thioredoxin-disulfide reductase [Patescibacteria group bacterium]MCG2692630.1 thioredoxin-disulfide reductase [Candidatus Parcubacteria bacterium]
MTYDAIIVGAGAAGLTAGLYAARRNLKTLILSKDIGGQTAVATEIENYPGVPDEPNGLLLMQKFRQQAESFGAVIQSGEVKSIKPQNNVFIVKTHKTNHKTKTVILAFGLIPRKLGVPGEKKFTGKGVVYCATCDGPLFRNKIVAVAGGGNSGLDAADFLAGIAKQVYLIHRRDKFRAEAVLQKKIQRAKNVKIILNSAIKKINGKDKVESIIVAETKKGSSQEIKVDGVFVEIGYEAKTDWLEGLIKLNEKNEIVTDENCQTNVPGIFAAGDVTDAPYKQIVISAGEGAKAALQAYGYIQHKGGTKEEPDWGR